MIIVVKKPILEFYQEQFAMIHVQKSDYLGGGMKILSTDMANIFGYKKYTAILEKNNDFHNSTDCITIDRYHLMYRDLKIAIGNQAPQKAYKYLSNIDGVYDVVETNESQSKGKYFIIVE